MKIKEIGTKAGSSSLATLETLGGFIGANIASKQFGVSTLKGTFAVLIVGLGIAIFSSFAGKGYIFEKMLPNVGNGVAVFGATKTINVLTADVVDTGVKGLGGFTLPDGIRNLLKDYTPQLGNAGTSLRGYSNGQPVELTKLADGSWGMKGLGYVPSLYAPELANAFNGIGEYSTGGAVPMLPIQETISLNSL